jgi:hypothetical protein
VALKKVFFSKPTSLKVSMEKFAVITKWSKTKISFALLIICNPLCRTRFQNRVAAGTNHVERFHARLNEYTQLRRVLPRRFGLLIHMLRKKAKHFHKTIFQSAKRKLTELGAIHDRDQHEFVCDCGWSAIYSARYQIPGFPCSHTCARHLVIIPQVDPIDIKRNSDHSLRVSDYTGNDWKCKENKDTNRNIGAPEGENPACLILDGLDSFVKQLDFEFSLMFENYHLTAIDLAADLGAFIVSWTKQLLRGDGFELNLPGLRNDFEHKWFDQLSKKK